MTVIEPHTGAAIQSNTPPQRRPAKRAQPAWGREKHVGDERETVGDRVRKLREARRISRASLASQVGVHPNTVHNLETNPLYRPDVATLERFARALDISTHYLRTGTWNEDISDLATFLKRDGRIDAEKCQTMLTVFDTLLRLQEVERNLTWNRFVRERDAAFGSLDREAIKAFCKEYGVPLQQDGEAFWIGVHQVRTGITSLPAGERRKSQEWLQARGRQSLDDGDI